MEFTKIHKDLLEYCANDYMGLWVVIWNITDAYSTQDPPEIVREKTVEVIREMLENGWIEIGIMVLDKGADDFQSLEMSVDKALDYIESEWSKLGKRPDIGEVCWFRATPKGRQLAIELGLLD